MDVGCGSGAASLHAREMGFHVTATDVSAAMVKRLYQRHEEKYGKERNHMLEVLAVDGQELPDSWKDQFDYAVGAFSVIFFPDVLKGLQQMKKCLVPGKGQVVISAWGTPEQTPAFRVFPDALKSVAPQESAKPKRLTGSPSVLRSLLLEAGFEDIRITGPVTQTLRVSSPEAFYDRFSLGSPHTAEMISRLTQEEQKRLKAKVMELAEARGGGRSDGAIEIPSAAYFAYGTKPCL